MVVPSTFMLGSGSGEVGAEAVGVGQGEGAEGGFPTVHGGAFDESAGGFAPAAGCAGFFGALPGAFVLDVADGQPQQFDHRVVGGEVPPVLDDFAELVVQALDRVGRINDLAGN